MKKHDVECPICGTVNHGMYLEETDGWMECEKCRNTVQLLKYARTRKVPLYTMEQLAQVFGKST